MPIREESFRIGCGRYIQGKGYIAKCGEEVLRVGTSPLIVGGKTALSVSRDKIAVSLSGVCKKYEFITHCGTCNDERAKEIAAYAKENGFDCIIGTGGGVLMDFAKLCAHFASLPVINIPTQSATCAAYTPLSVRYTTEGKTVGTLHYKKEVDAVIADTEIIAAQPTRLLLSGVFDSLAKFVEIKQRFREDDNSYPMGLDFAYVMAKRSFDILSRKIKKCISDIKEGNITGDVENIIFITIAATGAISGIARGSNQTALAHKFYEATRFFFPEKAKPFLHGEIVGIGLILQNYFNGEEENNASLISLMKEYDMPYLISDIGIPKSAEYFKKYYEKLCSGSAIDDKNEDECATFLKSLEYLWNIE